MSSDAPLQTCPICGENYLRSSNPLQNDPIRKRYNCERCGIYDFDDAIAQVNENFYSARHYISAWIRRQNKSEMFPVIVGKGMDISNMEWPLAFLKMGFPQTPNEKMNALLKAFADIVKEEYQKKVVFKDHPGLASDIAAKNLNEVIGLTNLLGQLEYVVTNQSNSERARITAKGWLRLDELSKGNEISDSAFVAMWFSDSTTEYREAVIAAILKCGYKPIILDQENFNGFVMDQVIASIKQARFVVADFTCEPERDTGDLKIHGGVRGGVYWEAGFAYGLNIPVIHTRKNNEDSKRRVHFDVDQYNTVFWTNESLGTDIRDIYENVPNPNFAEELAVHILKTVGKGSYTQE